MTLSGAKQPGHVQRRGGVGTRCFTGRALVLAVALASALLGGCAASDSDTESASGIAPPEPLFGGYTGSLVPVRAQRCGLTKLEQAQVPEGDTIGVVQTAGCENAQSFREQLALVGPNGDTPIITEPLAGSPGVLVVRTTEAITAGEYTLSAPGTEASTLSVAPASELPTMLGTLSEAAISTGADAGPACPSGWQLELQLSDEAKQYAHLLQLSVQIDGRFPTIWRDFGELDPEEAVQLHIPRCLVGCIRPGPHTVQVTAVLAGETETLRPEPLLVDNPCAERPSGEAEAAEESHEPPAGCSSLPTGSPTWWPLFVALLAAAARPHRLKASRQT